MRGLTAAEFALLDEIARTGDFYGYRPGDPEEPFDLAEDLEERGLVGWYYGPLSRECEGFLDEDDELDPMVTPLGRTLMCAVRIVGVDCDP
jgi:hypothetical protein